MKNIFTLFIISISLCTYGQNHGESLKKIDSFISKKDYAKAYEHSTQAIKKNVADAFFINIFIDKIDSLSKIDKKYASFLPKLEKQLERRLLKNKKITGKDFGTINKVKQVLHGSKIDTVFHNKLIQQQPNLAVNYWKKIRKDYFDNKLYQYIRIYEPLDNMKKQLHKFKNVYKDSTLICNEKEKRKFENKKKKFEQNVIRAICIAKSKGEHQIAENIQQQALDICPTENISHAINTFENDAEISANLSKSIPTPSSMTKAKIKSGFSDLYPNYKKYYSSMQEVKTDIKSKNYEKACKTYEVILKEFPDKVEFYDYQYHHQFVIHKTAQKTIIDTLSFHTPRVIKTLHDTKHYLFEKILATPEIYRIKRLVALQMILNKPEETARLLDMLLLRHPNFVEKNKAQIWGITKSAIYQSKSYNTLRNIISSIDYEKENIFNRYHQLDQEIKNVLDGNSTKMVLIDVVTPKQENLNKKEFNKLRNQLEKKRKQEIFKGNKIRPQLMFIRYYDSILTPNQLEKERSDMLVHTSKYFPETLIYHKNHQKFQEDYLNVKKNFLELEISNLIDYCLYQKDFSMAKKIKSEALKLIHSEKIKNIKI